MYELYTKYNTMYNEIPSDYMIYCNIMKTIILYNDMYISYL